MGISREQMDIFLGKEGLKELPYTPLEEPVVYLSKFPTLFLNIIGQYREKVGNQTVTVPGIGVEFVNGTYSTCDPRIVRYLDWRIAKAKKYGRSEKFFRAPTQKDRAKLSEVARRVKAAAAKIRADVEHEMEGEPILPSAQVDTMRVAPSPQQRAAAHHHMAEIASRADDEMGFGDKEADFDWSIFASEATPRVEEPVVMSEADKNLEVKPKPKRRPGRPKKASPVEETESDG